MKRFLKSSSLYWSLFFDNCKQPIHSWECISCLLAQSRPRILRFVPCLGRQKIWCIYIILNTGDRSGPSVSPCAFLQKQRTCITEALLVNNVICLLQMKSTVVFVMLGCVCFRNKMHSFPKKCNLDNLYKIRKTCRRTLCQNHGVPCFLIGNCCRMKVPHKLAPQISMSKRQSRTTW